MKAPLRIPLALLVAFAPIGAAKAQDPTPVAVQAVKYSAEQLDNLVAAIALYPDPILAQVLVASTFPEQIDFAAKHLRTNGTLDIDAQSWDVSVKSVAHYPPVLNMMADRPDWTTALGQAYAAQSGDVMQAVQRLRQMANAQGNLVSTPQQNVVVDRDAIRIEPAQPTVVYVPTYDPSVIYYEPVRIGGPYAGYWSFGVGFPIGGWLGYDCDWYGYNVFYAGWGGGAGGWRVRSSPFIVVNPVYFHPRNQPIFVGRGIFSHSLNAGALARFNTIHRSVNFENHGRAEVGAQHGAQRDIAFGGQFQHNAPPVNRGGDNRQAWNGRNDQRVQTAPPPQTRTAPPAYRGGGERSQYTPRQAAPPAQQQRSAPPPQQQHYSAPQQHSAPPSSHGSSGGSSHGSSTSSSTSKGRH